MIAMIAMMPRSFAVACLSIALFAPGCAGDDDRVTTGLSGGYNPTYTGTQTATASAGTGTDSSSSSGELSGSTSSESDSEDVTSASDGTTTTTTTTTGDPTTSTSSTSSTSSTTDMTTSTSTSTSTSTTSTSTGMMSTSTTTGANDPQPGNGLYSDCAMVNNCDFLCLQLTDANMMVLDGFCSKECGNAAECTPAPQSKATTTCIAGVGYCALACTVDADCPVGMTCEAVNVNNQTQNYCW